MDEVIVKEDGHLNVAISLLLTLVTIYLTSSVVLTLLGKVWWMVKRRKHLGQLLWDLLTNILIIFGVVFIINFLMPGFSKVLFNGFKSLLNACQPLLLKLFGVGGQGFLHLGSFYFIDIDKLSFSEFIWKFAAGGYTTVLSIMFLIPLMLLLSAYLAHVDDAMNGLSADSDNEEEQLKPQQTSHNKKSKKESWVCKICQTRNDGSSSICDLCEGHHWSGGSIDGGKVVAALTKEYLSEEDGANEKSYPAAGVRRKAILLDHFDMKSFQVLAQLGTGTTATVTLARITTTLVGDQLPPPHVEDDDRRNETIPPQIDEYHKDDEVHHNNSTNGNRFSLDEDEFDDDPALTSPWTPDYPSQTEFRGLGMKKSMSISTSMSNNNGSPLMMAPPLRSYLNNLTAPKSPTKGYTPSLASPRNNNKFISNGGGLRRSTRSVPSQLNQLQSGGQGASGGHGVPNGGGVGTEEWWTSVKWLNRNDVPRIVGGMTTRNNLLKQQQPQGSIPRNISNLSLGLDNSGVPEGLSPFTRASAGSMSSFQNQAASESETDDSYYWKGAEGKKWNNGGGSSSSVGSHSPPVMMGNGGTQAASNGRANDPYFAMSEMPELVAIKTIHKRKLAAMGQKACVERERQVLEQLSTPFICRMYGAFQDTTWAYLILEPVPAGDLASLLDARNVMFEEEAKFYIGCVLLALEDLHDHGIACLDIKPENTLLTEFGYVKLTDFGIAMFPAELHGGNWKFCGTPEYMSPEVVRQGPIEKGLPGLAGPDLWAVGILIFELLAGATPFGSEFIDNKETIMNIKTYASECETREKQYQQQRKKSSFASLFREVLSSTPSEFAAAVEVFEKHIEREKQTLLQSWFVDLNSKSAEVIDLITKLLRPDPRQRVPLSAPSAKGGDAVRFYMNHPWFRDDPEWSWHELRQRNVYPPFIPDVNSLAPPFRGEKVSVDITFKEPLTFAEFQAARDKQTELLYPPSSVDSSWEGFIKVSRPTISDKDIVGFISHAKALMENDSTAQSQEPFPDSIQPHLELQNPPPKYASVDTGSSALYNSSDDDEPIAF